MTYFSDVARYCYQHPGIIAVGDIVEAFGISRGAASRALLRVSRLEPKLLQQIETGVYMARPPEATDWQAPAPAESEAFTNSPPPPPEERAAATPLFEEILPDDADLYPPIKVQIYDHWRSRSGDQWFRVRDEHGKRGIFRYLNDDD